MRIPTYPSRRPLKGRTAAFTLLEVLVVVAILVILAGVGGTILFGAKEGAEKDIALTKIKALETVCLEYKTRHPGFPNSLSDLVSPPDGGSAYVAPEALNDPWGQPFQYEPQNPNSGGTPKPHIWSNGPPGSSTGPISN